jgi:hypothetical protein
MRFEAVDTGLQGFHGLNKDGDLSLKLGESLSCGRCTYRCTRFAGGTGGVRFRRVSEEMGVASLAGAGLAGEDDDEGTGGLGAGFRWDACGEAL